MSDARRGALVGLTVILLAGCVADPTATPSSSGSPSRTPAPTEAPSVSGSPTATGAPSATATPEPPLSLERPAGTDPRAVSVSVAPEIGDDGGRIVVTVTSQSQERIDELVLRWPTALGETLFLAPFIPSEDRIRDGGPPLVQPWTKWVVGPGEQGEPDGTISLGYGPLLAGATLEIPIYVDRRAPGPVAFDLQVLAGNDLLNLPNGDSAELRVEVP